MYTGLSYGPSGSYNQQSLAIRRKIEDLKKPSKYARDRTQEPSFRDPNWQEKFKKKNP